MNLISALLSFSCSILHLLIGLHIIANRNMVVRQYGFEIDPHIQGSFICGCAKVLDKVLKPSVATQIATLFAGSQSVGTARACSC